MWKNVEGLKWTGSGLTKVQKHLPEECVIQIYFNGAELASLSCSPEQLDDLVLGFLFSLGLIESEGDVTGIEVDQERRTVRVKSSSGETAVDRQLLRFYLPSGCGGVHLDEGLSSVGKGTEFDPKDVVILAKNLEAHSADPGTRAVHGAMLCDGSKEIFFCRDIGRHNAVDRIIGRCLKEKRKMSTTSLVISGRITLDVVAKAARAGIPVIVSRSGVTVSAIGLAEETGVTLIGYARGNSFDIYSNPGRVVSSLDPRNGQS